MCYLVQLTVHVLPRAAVGARGEQVPVRPAARVAGPPLVLAHAVPRVAGRDVAACPHHVRHQGTHEGRQDTAQVLPQASTRRRRGRGVPGSVAIAKIFNNCIEYLY